MKAWPKTRLGDHIRVRHGFAFDGRFFGNSGEYVVLTPGNFIESGGFREKQGAEKYYRATPPPGYVLRRGDLVVAMTEQAYGLLGSSALIPADSLYLHNQRIGLIEQSSTETDRRFLYYLFNTRSVRDQIQASATGSKIRHTAPKRIESVFVNLPPLSTQRKIAAVLAAYDDLIDNNNMRIKILEEIARRIYHEWFVDFRYPGHDEVHLVDSEVGPIPVDWSLHRLGDWVVQSARSIQPFRAPGALFEHFSIPAFDDRRLPAVEVGQAIHSNKFLVDGPSVLYSKLNPRIPRVWWANPTMGLQSVASTELMVLQSRDVADRALLYATLTSPAFLARVVGLAGGTSTSHQRVRPASVMAIPTLVPSQPVRNAFSAVATPLYQLASSLTRTSEKARALRDLLLPRLVSGEIDVTDLEIALPPTAA